MVPIELMSASLVFGQYPGKGKVHEKSTLFSVHHTNRLASLQYDCLPQFQTVPPCSGNGKLEQLKTHGGIDQVLRSPFYSNIGLKKVYR